MEQQQQSLLQDGRYMVSLDVFEGPLDLLLHLIKKHELDIFDIPIAFITQKYLEYLDLMKTLNLNLAAEYLEMAAHLAYVKSKMMLPNQDDDNEDDGLEEGPDPREELVRQLLEYQKYKTAADELADRPQHGRDVFIRDPGRLSSDEDRELASPGLFALMEALKQIFEKVDYSENNPYKNNEILITQISLTARIHELVDILNDRERVPFMELFEGRYTRGDIITTFLAILEMTKLNLAKVHQAGPNTEIHISGLADKTEAEQVLMDNKLEA
ncbi:MAG: segregation/condensation protein A [Deltaproteobacteria bacterium]|nr:segregation/condensation protein A [Deltaproteobacteria bacterium]MBN2674146.1 segregation/condensation protein A [Deltaproteobacteria bacterium]